MRKVWILLGFLAGCDDADEAGGGDAAVGIDGGGAGGAGGAGGQAGAGGEGGQGGAGGDAPECRTHDDCTAPGRIFCTAEGRCVGCTGDSDCTVGTVCEAELCVAGCRGHEGCPEGGRCVDGQCQGECAADEDCADLDHICRGGVCGAGCRGPEQCPRGFACEGDTCVEGCDLPDDCDRGQICQLSDPGRAGLCVDGCTEDAGCLEGSLCIAGHCIARGVGCHGDGDCGAGDRCAPETERCVPTGEECPPDAREVDDAFPTPLAAGRHGDLRVCPGDLDRALIDLAVGDTLTVVVEVAAPEDLVVELLLGDRLALAEVSGGTLRLAHQAAQAGLYELAIRGRDAAVRASYVLTIGVEALPMCMDLQVFPDGDGDGYGVEAGAMDACLAPDEVLPGFAREAGDCGPGDAWRNPGAEEICRDFVDDDCNGADGACPESRPGVAVPNWACDANEPPANVVAWAKFDNGGGYFRDGGCFVFFEGHPGEFYVQRRLDRASNDASCNNINGCTCPSLNGWPSYDRRMYAFTTVADAGACPTLSIIDHGGEQQPVSNDCRKYLYQMHFYDIPFSYVAGSLESLQRRFALFPNVEVACVQDLPHANLPYQSLLTTPIRLNEGYVPLR